MATYKLNRSHRILVGVVLAGAVVIATIGFAGSYAAVRELAEEKGFGEFAPYFPIGIDAGIVVLLALDLLLTWLRIPFPLLRQTAWLLTAATIAFNGASAWGDPLAVSMHGIIPVLFVITVEAARHAIGRVADITADKHMEGVRLWRWILAPVPTFRLWRRMKLWELRSYEEVIGMERDRLVYQAHLRAEYGRRWRRKAPMDARMPLKLARYGVPVAEGRSLVGQQREPLPAAPEANPLSAPAAPGPAAAVEPPAPAQPAPRPAPAPEPQPQPQPQVTVPQQRSPQARYAEQPRPEREPDAEPVPQPEPPRVTVPAGPGRRRALGRAPANGHLPQPEPEPEPEPFPAAFADPEPLPLPDPDPGPVPGPEPLGLPDDVSHADAYFAAYRQYVMEHGGFPNARQLARFLNERFGVTSSDGSLLNEQYLREFLRGFRERYNAEMGLAG
ncbi:DUF2637 domain-containing protein [Streptomyces sp. 4N509B]|uniref:DUF2637 domain-containing protein n=1 Tax=Streptomyces sp. 4N509B TaxID=3457413 RepID=UPI003FD13B65